MIPAVPCRVRNRVLRFTLAAGLLSWAVPARADVVTSAPNASLVETVTLRLGGTNELAKNGIGTTWLAPAGQTNDFTGRTTVNDGVLRGDDGSGLSPFSQLYLNGGNGNTRPSGVIESRGAFTRAIGAATGEVFWANYGGFAAHAGDLAVTLEGGAQIPWVGVNDGFNAKLLTFGSFTADRTTDLRNGIALGAARSVYVYDNTNSDRDVTLFSGAISNGSASAFGLAKYGDGTLALSGANSFSGGLTIGGGAVRAVSGAGLPTGGRLILSAPNAAPYNAILESSGPFNWNIGSANGEVSWSAYGGGFAANGGTLNVNLEGGAVLNWGDANTGFNAQVLTLGSRTADGMVALTNDIELGAARTIYTIDNPFRTSDFARVAGRLLGNAVTYNLTVAGDGILELSALNNSYRGSTILNGGMLRVTGSIISNNTLTVAAGSTLAGTGVIMCTNAAGVTITGTVAPGVDGVGLLTVSSNLTFAAAARYELDIGPGAACDRLDVSSNVTINAGFVVMPRDTAGGGCSATDQLTLLTYGRACLAFPTNNWKLDGSAIRTLSRWNTNGAALVHDVPGRRVYLTGITVQPKTAGESMAWIGGSGNWTDADWTGPLAFPALTTRALLDAPGVELAVSGSQVAHALALSNGTVRIGSGASLGAFFVDAAGLLDVQGALTNVETLTVRPAGTLRVSGTLSAGALASQGNSELQSGAALTLGTWAFSQSQQVPSGASVAAGQVEVATNLSIQSGGSVSAGVWNVKADLEAVAGSSMRGTVVLGDEADATVRGTAAEKAMMVFDAGTLHVPEAATVGGLDFTLGGILDRVGASGTMTVKGPLILNGRSFNIDAEQADLSQATVVATNLYGLISANPFTVGSLQVYGPLLQVAGPLVVTNRLSLEDVVVSNAISGDGLVIIGESRLRDSLVWLAGTNSYAGKTQVERGTLRALPGIGLPDAVANGNLEFSGDTAGQHAMLEASGSMSRNIGTGAREVSWDNNGGFAAWGGALDVTLEGGSLLSWSNAADGFNNRQLYLNSTSADSVVTFANPIKVDGDRTLRVYDNWRTNVDLARLTGTISMDHTNRNLRKESEGLLWLTGTNTFGGKLIVDDGVLRAEPGVGLPASAYLWLSAAAVTRPSGVFESSGTFSRNIGPLAGEVYWENAGGFAAQGGPLAVSLEGGSTLVWTNAFTGFNVQSLIFGSFTADNVADLQNPISLNGNRSVYVFDNTNTSADAARLSGVIANGISSNCALQKYGDGVLWLTGSNTLTGGMTNNLGVVRLQPGVGLPTNGAWFAFAQPNDSCPGVLECQGALSLPLGPVTNGLFWVSATARGGFAARGGPLTASLLNGGPLAWGGATNGFSGGILHLGSRSADNVTDLRNDLLLQGIRVLWAFDNPDSAQDRARLSGNISNGDATPRQLQVYGNGVVELAGSNTFGAGLLLYGADTRVNGLVTSAVHVAYAVPASGAFWPVLSGTGRVSGITAYLSGVVAPGDGGVGTLASTGAVTFKKGSVYDWEIGPDGTGDLLAVEGNLTFEAGWVLRLRDGGGIAHASDVFPLMTFTGYFATNAAWVLDPGLMNPDLWDTRGCRVIYDSTNHVVSLTGLQYVGPEVEVPEVSVVEGNAGTTDLVFTVAYTYLYAGDTEVAFATADGTASSNSDYVCTTGSVVVEDGGIGYIHVPVNGDLAKEWPSEAFYLQLAAPPGIRIRQSRVKATIVDDDGGFAYRMKIGFPGYTGAETLRDFPALVKVSEGSGGFSYAGLGSPDGADLRFMDASFAQELPAEIDTWNRAGDSYLWVKVPVIAGTNSYIWAVWGDPSLTTPPASRTNGEVWSASYLGVYHLNSISNTLFADSGPRRFHGTNLACRLADGAIGRSADLVGVNAINLTGMTSSEQSYTFECLARSADQVAGKYILDIGAGRHVLGFNQAAAGQISYFNNAWRQGGGTALNDGRWHALAWVVDRNANQVTVFADGVLAGTNTLAAVYANIGGEIRVGGVYNAIATYSYEGQLDEFRIAARARTADWMAAAYRTLCQNAAFTSYGTVESGAGGPVAAEPLAIGNRPAGGIAGDQAVLNGIVLATGGGANPDVVACWATNDCGTASTGAWTYAASLGSGRGAGEAVSNLVTGLTLGQAWCFRFYATNGTGEAWASPAESFTQPRGLYVASSGDGSDGLGWATAFTNIQTALSAARPGDAVLLKGERFNICSLSGGTNQLELTNGSVTVRGGYEGAGAPGPRNPAVWETVITRSAGTNRLMRLMNVDDVRIEGITFTNGFARVQAVGTGVLGHPDGSGAGLFIQGCQNVVLEDCKVVRNWGYNPNGNGYAIYGGGVAVMTSRVSFVRCAINSNRCTTASTSNRQNGNGGGIGGLNHELTVTDCDVIGNRVSGDVANELDCGGGIMVNGIGAIRRTVLRDNDIVKPTNDANTQGDGVYVNGSALLENCLLTVNGQYTNTVSGSANYAVYVAGGYATLRNCTIADHKQAGVYRVGGSVLLQNCILWNNGNDIWENIAGTVQLVNTLTKDGDSEGVNGCITGDPRFADTNAYHLKSTIGHYAGGTFSGGAWTTAAENSPGIDAGLAADSYAAEPHPNGGRVNLGAYGGTELASMSIPMAVSNLAATAVTPSSAVLNGLIAAVGSGGTEIFFGWGDSDEGADVDAWQHRTSAGVYRAPGPVSLAITGLTGNVTYYYTLIATNAGAAVSAIAAPSLSFSTVISPPIVANAGVLNESGPLVTLKGEVVSSGGDDPDVYVCWGSLPAGNDTGLWEHVESLGPETGPFQAVVGAGGGSNYYYTCHAVNSAGQSWATPPVPFGATNLFYVAATATGQGTGQGWANAFSNLQDAISACLPGKPSVIHVKGGAGEVLAQAVAAQLTLPDLALYGGYQGVGWPGPRDPAAWPSVLTRKPSNFIRILSMQGVTNGLLDGFMIVGGVLADNGGGLLLQGCSNISVVGCTFLSNRAENAFGSFTSGGGLFASNSFGVMDGCRFERNTAYNNVASGNAQGGALYITNGAWEVRHTLLFYNTARSVSATARGGGAAIFGGQHRFFDTLVIQNLPWGAADNTNSSQGGGFFLANTALLVENSTLSGNISEGIRGAGASTIRDSILWHNGDDLAGAPAYLGTSCVGDGDNAGTNGCFTNDPLFAYGYYLASTSPCAGAGSQTAAAVGLDGRTTRTGGEADADTVDLGWHAPAGITPFHELYVDAASGDNANSGTNAAEALASVTRALTLAPVGGRIHVAAGLYDMARETYPLLVDKAGLQLLGEGAATTILTATGASQRVLLVSEAPAVRISGFAIQGGYLVPYSGQQGAGIAVSRAVDARIDRCVLAGNANVGGANENRKGGGLYAYLSTGVIEDSDAISNLVNDSVANYNGYAYGGGLMFEGGAWTARRCVIRQNTCSGPGYQGAGGAGISTVGGVHQFENCLVATNATINHSYIPGGSGMQLDSTARVVNCTVAFNTSPANLSGHSSIRQFGTAPVTLVNCIVTGNTNDLAGFATNELGQAVTVSYSFLGGGMNDGFQGCLTGDPMFADRTYFHLLSHGGYLAGAFFEGGDWVKADATSPLIDRGDPASDWSAEPKPNGKRVNLGAYGNTPAASRTTLASGACIVLY